MSSLVCWALRPRASPARPEAGVTGAGGVLDFIVVVSGVAGGRRVPARIADVKDASE
jgi:hypothetical protein